MLIDNLFKPTHKVKLLTNAEGMSLREEPDSSIASFMKIKDGAEVQFLSMGDKASMGNVNGFWFKIKTKENINGWCFSGSIVKILEKNTIKICPYCEKKISMQDFLCKYCKKDITNEDIFIEIPIKEVIKIK